MPEQPRSGIQSR